jgi:hypothetical protein
MAIMVMATFGFKFLKVKKHPSKGNDFLHMLASKKIEELKK